MTCNTTTTTEAPAFAETNTMPTELSLYASASSVPAELTDEDNSAIDLFCDQCLQLEPRPQYPDGNLLKRAKVQNEIYDRIGGDDERPLPGNARLQLGVLKEVASRIQASIGEEESDDYEVSDSIMARICQLVSLPQVSDVELAQMKCLVTYRLSHLGPPSRHIQILENRNLLAARGGSGHRTWAAALYLGRFLCQPTNRHLTQGKRILELGAGTGFVSILCRKHLGATHVIASEGDEEVLDSMTDNLVLNECGYSHSVHGNSSGITPKLLKWGHALVGTEEPEWNGGQRVDLIVGADITYDRNGNAALASTLRSLLDLYPDAEVVISVTERNPTTLSVFREACHQNRLRVDVLEHAVDAQDEELAEGGGQRNMSSAPFYTSSAPIRIYRIGAA